jgi:tetratricopeptide (TPR) repeat protein
MEGKKYFWQDNQGNTYGPFRMDEEGNPHAGDVVRHYRLHRNMSTSALGKALDKTARWVQLMEHNNTVPELISRRKLIIKALGIPPILMFPNLYGNDDLVRGEDHHKPPPIQEYNSSASGSLDLRYCSEMLQLYWCNYHVSAAQNLLGAIEEKIQILLGFVAQASGKEHSKALTLLCQYRQLAALIAGERDDFDRAFMHLNPAVAIAEEMQDVEMQAVTLFRRGLTHSAQGNLVEAFVDLKQAASFEGFIPATLIGRILLSTGKAEARVIRKEQRETLNLFEKAWKIIRDGKKEEDTHFIRLNEGNYHEHKASALAAMGNLTEAAEELQEAHETFPADQTRRHNNIDTMQAELAANSGEHVIAASVALRTFDVAKQLDMTRNINTITTVYSQLSQGPYRKSKDIRDLGDKLRELNKTASHLH